MKTIIAGSRNVTDPDIIEKAVTESGFEITEVIEGGAKGVDTIAREWAQKRPITVTEYKANWAKFGKAAGPIRNKTMADNADALIAVWDGESRGTKNMIELARKLGLKVFIYNL